MNTTKIIALTLIVSLSTFASDTDKKGTKRKPKITVSTEQSASHLATPTKKTELVDSASDNSNKEAETKEQAAHNNGENEEWFQPYALMAKLFIEDETEKKKAAEQLQLRLTALRSARTAVEQIKAGEPAWYEANTAHKAAIKEYQAAEQRHSEAIDRFIRTTSRYHNRVWMARENRDNYKFGIRCRQDSLKEAEKEKDHAEVARLKLTIADRIVVIEKLGAYARTGLDALGLPKEPVTPRHFTNVVGNRTLTPTPTSPIVSAKPQSSSSSSSSTKTTQTSPTQDTEEGDEEGDEEDDEQDGDIEEF